MHETPIEVLDKLLAVNLKVCEWILLAVVGLVSH